jgi:hypothetical protein
MDRDNASLVGTWRLLEVADKKGPDGHFNPEGTWTFPYGKKPAGYFVYDATGHVSIHIMKTPAPAPFSSGDDATPTSSELKAVYDGYVGYFGRYSVDEANGIVIHHVEGSLWPSFIGTDQKRPFELSGDRLTIGDQHTWQRVLERVK